MEKKNVGGPSVMGYIFWNCWANRSQSSGELMSTSNGHHLPRGMGFFVKEIF